MNEPIRAMLAEEVEHRVIAIEGVAKLFPPRGGLVETGLTILRQDSGDNPLVRISQNAQECTIELNVAVTIESRTPDLARLIKSRVTRIAEQHGIVGPLVRITVSHLPAA